VSPQSAADEQWVLSDDPWKLEALWPAVFHDVAPWREYFEVWICPGSDRAPGSPWGGADGATGVPSYHYSNSFGARPEVWSEGAIADPQFVRPVMLADVVTPSQKVVMLDAEQAHVPPQQFPSDVSPLLFVDGHARDHRFSLANRHVVNPFTGMGRPLHDTLNGVRGRDY